jgi:hypothetical protein
MTDLLIRGVDTRVRGGLVHAVGALRPGRSVVENDAIPGPDLAQLRADARAFVQTLLP